MMPNNLEFTQCSASRARFGETSTPSVCSEHEPLSCHRCLLVGRRLAARGNDLAHILRDGTIEPNTATGERLLALTRQTDADLFAPGRSVLPQSRAQDHEDATMTYGLPTRDNPHLSRLGFDVC
jgi:hypothetical protein